MLYEIVLGSDKKGVEEEDSDSAVLATDLITVMECAIFTFHLFLKMDKKRSSGVRNIFGGQNQLATPLQQVQSSLEKVTSISLSCTFFLMLQPVTTFRFHFSHMISINSRHMKTLLSDLL